MAARFWVTTGTTGGTGNWSDAQNWSTTSGGTAGASVPGSADTAAFDASSGSGTATLDSNVTIQTMNMTGFTGTFAFGTNTISLNSSGAVFNGSTTCTITGTPVINVTSAGATAITVNTISMTEANSISFNFTAGTYGLTIGNFSAFKNLNFVSSGTTGFGGTLLAHSSADITLFGSITLSSNMTHPASVLGYLFAATSGTQIITSNGKTFDMPMALTGVGGTTKLADAFILGATRTFNFNNGTFDGNGQTITGGTLLSASAGGVTYFKGLNTARPFTVTNSTTTLTGPNTTGVFTFTLGSLSLGTYTLSASTFNSSNGNTRTLDFGTGNITITNTAGGTLWNTSTITGLTVSGTPIVNISNASANAATVIPGAMSEANSISFNFINGTYLLTFLATGSNSAKNVSFSGFGGTWGGRTLTSTIYGNLTLSSDAGFSMAASTGVVTFGATSGAQIFTSNGKTFDGPITINGVGGTVQLADALTMGATRALALNNGTFDANNQTVSGMASINSNLASGNITLKNLSTSVPYGVNASGITSTLGTNITFGIVTLTTGTINLAGYQLTCSSFSSSNTGIRTIAFGTGNITCSNNAGGTLWTTLTATNLTISGTPTVNITNSSGVATTVASGATTETTVLSFNITTGSYVFTSPNFFKSLSFATAFTGTWTHAAQILTFFGDVTLSSAMTYGGGNGGITFAATSGTQTITSNGKSWATPITQSNSGATLRLADALTQTTYQYLHNSGTLDLNGKTLAVGTNYATGTGTKNITFNAGTLLCAAATTSAFNNAVPTGFSTTAGTGTGKISMTAATAKTFVGGDSTFNCTLSNDGAGALTISGSNTFTTIANGVQPTQFTFTAATTTTVTNFNVSGISGSLVTINSATAATHTLSKTSGNVLSQYLSITNSIVTGGAAWYAANSTNVSGNSGWIFGVNKYWVGGTGNWSDAARWATSSGGAGGSGITLADAAVFDALSGGGTVTINSNVIVTSLTTTGYTGTLAFGTNTISLYNVGAPYTGGTAYSVSGTPVINITYAGSTITNISAGVVTEANSISFNFTAGTYSAGLTGRFLNLNFTGFSGSQNAAAIIIYGDYTLSSTMTVSSSGNALTFASTSTTTRIITTNGVTILRPINLNGVGGKWLLADSLTTGTQRSLTHTNGTLDLNGKTLTIAANGSYITALGTKNLTFNGGTIIILSNSVGIASQFNNAAPTGFTTTAGTGTGKISFPVTGLPKTFTGGGSVFNCTVSNDGVSELIITGDNTITTLANGIQPTTFTFTAGTTQTITNWSINGTAGNLVTINSSTAGTPASLSKASGTVSVDYLSIQDSSATGGAAWYAGANSTNVSGNSGWIFSAPPVVTAGGNFFFMF